MNIFDISLASIGLLFSAYFAIKWKKIYAGAYIDDKIMSIRQHYRYYFIGGLLLFCASLTDIIDSSFSILFLIGIWLGYSHILFEPYFNASVVNKLGNFCLYLRPFATDSLKNGFVKGTLWLPESIEKTLFDILNLKVAQPFAIGNPNECIPTTLSTTNIYANDSEWKETVAKLAQNAKIIILRVGDTEGCMWEIAHCVKNDFVNKTIFLIENNDMFVLIKEKTGEMLSNVIFDNINNNSAFALFCDNENEKWKAFQIQSKNNLHNIVDSYISTHSSLRKYLIEQKKDRGIFNMLSKESSPSKIWQCLSFLINPIAYGLFNKWPKIWWFVFILYIIFVFLTAFYLEIVSSESEIDENMRQGVFVILGYFVLLIPWLWLAPRISWRCRNWGSREIFAKTNRILALWLLFLLLSEMVVSMFSVF